MKILCLHGVGSSALILENQLRQLMSAVDPSYEFVFVDGPIPSERGPGVQAYIEAPFYSHTAGYSIEDMNEATQHLSDTFDELGPFDGVLGFSQGAALVTSWLHKQLQNHQKPPVRFALLFSSVMPCAATPSSCEDAVHQLLVRGQSVENEGLVKEPSLSREERLFVQLLHQTIIPSKKQRQMLPDYDLSVYSEGDGLDAPRLMHPQLIQERILIPTIHVTGKRDQHYMRAMSEVAYGLYDGRMTKKLEHSGGHEPPQKITEIKAVIRALEWALRQAEQPQPAPYLRL
ncbi:DUF341 domain protein [Periconia macrospinosa]|uniref:DUF341 domain protein n=1 Tax=Periconia macrospinosa TaxID=97972 RepID=A0A2V1DZL8_9PLEO|nr:DUF341 domain protein [Periconia macrospinosa]